MEKFAVMLPSSSSRLVKVVGVFVLVLFLIFAEAI